MDGIIGSNTPTSVTVTSPSHVAGTVAIAVHGGGGVATSSGFTYEGAAGPPAVPTGVDARATSSTSIRVTWTPVSGATSYNVERRAPGGSFMTIGTSPTATFDDTVAPNTSYLYRVAAVSGTGTSAFSGPDIATSIVWTNPILTGYVLAVHFQQLQNAANAARQLAALPVTTFANISAGQMILALHLYQIRAAIEEAMAVVGFPPFTYTNPTLKGQDVKGAHVQEPRNRVQ